MRQYGKFVIVDQYYVVTKDADLLILLCKTVMKYEAIIILTKQYKMLVCKAWDGEYVTPDSLDDLRKITMFKSDNYTATKDYISIMRRQLAKL